MRILLLVLAFLGPVGQADEALQRAVQAARRPALERPARMLSEVGKPVVVLGALLLVAVVDNSAGVATARLALITLLPVNGVVELLKRATDRTRPDGEHKRSNASFPSSHAANAFAIAAVLARRYRRMAPWAWIGAAAIAASRVYLDRHYVSDVVVGAVIGAAGALGVARALGPKLDRRGPSNPSEVSAATR
jgi:membrane-associated phospholipid phosphatase